MNTDIDCYILLWKWQWNWKPSLELGPVQISIQKLSSSKARQKQGVWSKFFNKFDKKSGATSPALLNDSGAVQAVPPPS